MLHLLQNDLDPAAWDACLEAAGATVPYASYAWLRAVNNGRFTALVWPGGVGKYQAIFPIPQRRKGFVLPYVAMPAFTQRLGLFARPGHDALALAGEAARHLARRFIRADMAVQEKAVAYTLSENAWPMRNLVLRLEKPLPELEAGLGKSIRQKLKQAEAAGLSLRTPPTGLSAFSFIREQLVPRLPFWTREYDYAWGRLCIIPGARFKVYGRMAYQGEEPVAAAAFVQYGSRTIYLAGASNAEGLATGAMAYLLWQEMQALAGRPGVVLDFEGGNLGGTRQFFSMFGAEEETYWGLRIGL